MNWSVVVSGPREIRTPRRAARLMFIAIALGLVTTVLVAWWWTNAERPRASWVVPPNEQAGRVGQGVPCWNLRTWTFTGFTTASCSPIYAEREAAAAKPYPATVPGWSMTATPPTEATIPDDGSRAYVWFGESAAGWPLRAVYTQITFDGRLNRNVSPNYIVEQRWAIRWTSGSRDWVLPYRPLWTGLLANTALYAAAWTPLVLLPGAVARWRRARQGRCMRCGYARAGLKADAACPECGAGPA